MIDLDFNHVSKRYSVSQESTDDAAKHPLMRKLQSLRRRSQEFWALSDVSFQVERGEALGIIGHNGAGKSTILKLLSNITTPTSGEIIINGRLSALIEVGSGFHPELTGRENVYLSGSILGMRRREIADKLDSIVDFAGVKTFIDTPVKRYSSGMYVRLGFSIAAHLDPDILLLDEVLAVGDASFQAKCLQRIEELKQTGTTIVFISHDLGAVERLCDRVVLMQRGQVAASGTPHDVIEEYQGVTKKFVPSAPPTTGEAELSNRAAITGVSFHDPEGNETQAFSTGRPLIARLEYTAREHVPDVALEIFFSPAEGAGHCQLTTALSKEPLDLEPGTGLIEFYCPALALQPGIYYIDATVTAAVGGGDWQYRCATIRVDPGVVVRGEFYMPHQWRFIERSSSSSSNESSAHASRSANEVVSSM